MNMQLSNYGEEQLVRFLQDEKLQNNINDMAVFMNTSTINDIVEVCITMFLANVDINRLHPDDLNILRSELRDIRATGSLQVHRRSRQSPQPLPSSR